MDVNEFLEHHGTKGMKWGVRKPIIGSGYAGSGMVRVLNAKGEMGSTLAGFVGNAHIYSDKVRPKVIADYKELHKKYDIKSKKFMEDDAYYAQYREEARRIFEKHLNNSLPPGLVGKAFGHPDLTRPSYIVVGNKAGIEKETKALKKEGFTHAAEDPVSVRFELKEVLDSDGYVVDASIGDQLEHQDSVEEFLAHHGIRGMKWGIRRSPAQLAREHSGPSPRADGRPPWHRPPTRKSPSSHSSTTKEPPPHQKSHDQVIFEQLKLKAKKGGIHSLSNEEIRVLTSRAEALRKVNTTFPKKKTRKAKVASFVIDDLLIKSGKKTLQSIADEQMKQLGIKKGLLPKKEDKKKNED